MGGVLTRVGALTLNSHTQWSKEHMYSEDMKGRGWREGKKLREMDWKKLKRFGDGG